MYSEEMSSQQESEAEIDLEKMAAAKQRKEHRTGVIKEMEDRVSNSEQMITLKYYGSMFQPYQMMGYLGT